MHTAGREHPSLLSTAYRLPPRVPSAAPSPTPSPPPRAAHAPRRGARRVQVSTSFGTISEYFFLTLRVLNKGLLSSFGLMENLMKQHSRLQQELQMREDELARQRGMGGMGAQVCAAAAIEIERGRQRRSARRGAGLGLWWLRVVVA